MSGSSSSSSSDEESHDNRWAPNRYAPDCQPIPEKLAAIEALRANVTDWQSPKERRRFLRRLDPLVQNWREGIPDLREIFRTKEIELLLQESLNHIDARGDKVGNRFIVFVCRARYHAVPELDEATGEPILRRTTALHLAARRFLDNRNANSKVYREIFNYLLRIYLWNNVDEEDGYSHFHIVCQLTFAPSVYLANFLDFDEASPNELVEKTGDTPLHLVEGSDVDKVKLLLLRGANPYLANKQGQTPLHVMGGPSCRRALQAMIGIAGASGRPVLIDARDELGRTPLAMAVERLDLEKVELLLDYGADAALVDMPVWTYTVHDDSNPGHVALTNFELAAGALAVVECLEKRGGYVLDRCDVSRIMKTFAQMGEYLTDREAMDRSWYEDERFVEEAKKLMILPRASSDPEVTTEIEDIEIGGVGEEGGGGRGRRSKPSREEESSKVPRLSVYDLIPMRPEEAAKIVTYKRYYELATSPESWRLGYKLTDQFAACTRHLSEKLARGFFRRWALHPFLELTRNELPILCCEKIIELLLNRDLHNICLAVGDQDSQ